MHNIQQPTDISITNQAAVAYSLPAPLLLLKQEKRQLQKVNKELKVAILNFLLAWLQCVIYLLNGGAEQIKCEPLSQKDAINAVSKTGLCDAFPIPKPNLNPKIIKSPVLCQKQKNEGFK